jgi:HAD superfamily hydrolase (TIGR01509 family)
MIRALIFDFDGIVLDTEVPIYRAWAELYERHGLDLPLDFWATTVGQGPAFFDPIADLEQRLGRRVDRDATRDEIRRRVVQLLSALPVLPGVHQWREEACERGVALGVASNSSRLWVRGHLERLGLDGWACVRCRDDVERPKPAPDLYLAVTRCLGVAPSEAIAVEDSESGVEAARAAGVRCVAVPSALTAGHDLSGADLVLGSLSDATFGDVAVVFSRL